MARQGGDVDVYSLGVFWPEIPVLLGKVHYPLGEVASSVARQGGDVDVYSLGVFWPEIPVLFGKARFPLGEVASSMARQGGDVDVRSWNSLSISSLSFPSCS